jgi:hypothetical protein
MVGTFHCSFIMVQHIDVSSSNETKSPTVDHPVGLGLFSTSVYDLDANLLGCVSYYSRDEFDGAFRAARSFGMVSTVSTTIALICVTLVTLFIEPLHLKVDLWSVARLLFFTAFLCQLLTFLAFARELCNRSDMQCDTGPASNLSMFNLLLLCFQSALIYVVPPVPKPLFFRRVRKPMSFIEMAHNDEDRPQNIQAVPDKPSSVHKLRPALDDDQPDDEVSVKNDLESDNGSCQQQQGVVMEGIECVAEDHLRRGPEGPCDRLAQIYYAIGQHPNIRTFIGAGLYISWIFILVETTPCSFLLVGSTGQDRNDFSGIGLYNRAYYMNDQLLGCIAYPSTAKGEFDGAFEVGRAFGIMTLLLITASFVSFSVLHAFLEPSRNKEVAWWSLTQLTLPCALLSQLITFAAFETQACTRSDSVECVAGVAGIFGILNAILLVPLSVVIFALSCPTKPFFRMRTLSLGRASPRPGLALPRKVQLQVKQLKEHMKQQRLRKQEEGQESARALQADESPLKEQNQRKATTSRQETVKSQVNRFKEQVAQQRLQRQESAEAQGEEESPLKQQVPEPSSTSIVHGTDKSQVTRFKDHVKQQQQLPRHDSEQAQREKGSPEPSTTHSLSACSEGGFDDRLKTQSSIGDTIALEEEGVEVCDTYVEEKAVQRTSTQGSRRSDGSSAVDDIKEHNGSDNPSSTGARVAETTSMLAWPSSATFSGWRASTGPTATTRDAPTRDGISLSLFWDSQDSLEQHETMEVENGSSAAQSKPSRGVIRNPVDASATVRTTSQDLKNAKCCMVQQKAMEILREMQEQKQTDQEAQREVIEPQPALVRSFAIGRAQAKSPMTNTSSLISVKGSSSLVSSSDPNMSATCESSIITGVGSSGDGGSSIMTGCEAIDPSKRTVKTSRGGRVNAGSAGSSDAVGINDPDDDTYSDFRSKISSTEDDGHTFNTGDYAINNDNVTVYYKRREGELEAEFGGP